MRQAVQRILSATLTFMVLIALLAVWFHRSSLEQGTKAEVAQLRKFYQDRLVAIEHQWQTQAVDLKNDLEFWRILEDASLRWPTLSGYLTTRGEGIHARSVVITDRDRRILFQQETGTLFPDGRFPLTELSGWLRNEDGGDFYRFTTQPLWLGRQQGAGWLIQLFRLDTALLRQNSFPATELSLWWRGQQVAHSRKTVDSSGPRPDGLSSLGERLIYQLTLPWEPDRKSSPMLVLWYQVPQYVTYPELLLVTVGMVPVMGVFLFGPLGWWMLRMVRRITRLGEVARTFALDNRITPAIRERLAEVRQQGEDEIGTVAASLEELTQAVVQRDSEQAVQEERLRESDARMREIAAMIADGIFVVDALGEITFLNAQAERLLGWRESELLGRNSHEMFHYLRPDGTANPADTCQIHRTVITGEPFRSYEDYFVRKDGSLLPVALASSPILRGWRLAGAVITFEDHTERIQSERALREREDRFRALAHSLQDTILIFDAWRQVHFMNRRGEAMFGIAEGALLGSSVARLFPERLTTLPWEERLQELCGKLGGRCALTVEGSAQRVGGEEFPVEIAVAAWESSGERWYSAAVRDISERRMLERRDLRAYVNRIAISALLEVGLEPMPLDKKLQVALSIILTVPWLALQSKGAVFLVIDEQKLSMVVQQGLSNHLLTACREIPFGFCLCGRAAQTGEICFSGDLDERHDIRYDGIRAHGHYCVPILSRGELLGVLNLYVAAGHPRDPEEEAFLTTIANTLAGLIERGRVEERISHLASHDILTGLPNRRLFGEHLERELHHALRNSRSLAVAFLDLDHFKEVNDTLGHEAGDLLLKTVTTRLRQCLRDSDTLARMGGDEFTLILPSVDTASNAALVAGKILRALAEPIVIFDTPCHIGVSIGISLFPEHGSSAESLVQCADQAMYEVKKKGRNGFVFYTPGDPSP